MREVRRLAEGGFADEPDCSNSSSWSATVSSAVSAPDYSTASGTERYEWSTVAARESECDHTQGPRSTSRLAECNCGKESEKRSSERRGSPDDMRWEAPILAKPDPPPQNLTRKRRICGRQDWREDVYVTLLIMLQTV
jgi:hypothetical protein